MKKTGLVLALATLFIVATVCATGSVDAASGSESSFPSASEILSTVEWPDYSFQTFLDDAKIMFSAGAAVLILGLAGIILTSFFKFVGGNDGFIIPLVLSVFVVPTRNSLILFIITYMQQNCVG